ncbi:hypothetical protein ELE02_32710, partial [Klebsiella pneumoniae]|nr:hypothetical protein [Klebsiella pneumoniae]
MHVESPNFTFSSIILEHSLRTSTLFIYLIFYFIFEYREYIKNKKLKFSVPVIFQFALNIALILLAFIFFVLLGKEI